MSNEPNWLEFFEDRERLYADYYLDFAQQHARRDPEAYDQLEAESGNLLKIAAWLSEHDEAEGVLGLATALWQESDFLRSRGYMQRGLPLLEQARQAAQVQGDVEAEFKWLEAVAHIHLLNGNPSLSQPLYEQALRLAQSSDHPLLEAHAQLGLGRLFTDLGELDKAVACLKDALQNYRTFDDYGHEIEALTGLGNALCLHGYFAEAINYLKSSLPMIQSRQDQRGKGEVHYALGYAAALAEDWTQAVIYFKTATDIAREIGDRFREIRGLSALGEAWLALGDIQKSVTLLEEALIYQEGIDDIITKALTHFYLAKAYRALNAPDDCLTQLKYVSPFHQVPILATLATEATWIKANIYFEQGRINLAKATLQDVLNLAPEQMINIRNQAKLLLETLEQTEGLAIEYPDIKLMWESSERGWGD